MPGSITVSVIASNGFNSSASIAISNLPSGVTVAPSDANLSAGQSQQFIFTASSSASGSNSTVSVTASFGSLSQQAALALQVDGGAGTIALSRTRYVRTDAVEPYTVLFDSANNRFFMTDPGSNQIFVLDAGTRKQIGSIVVPGAYGMDETPDHSVLYAATQIGDVYSIDPAKMAVTHRYIASQIGPKGYQAYVVQVMANGELALLGGQGGIPSVDGYSSFAFWNPSTNSLETSSQIGKCAAHDYIFTFTVTGDRSLLVLTNLNTTGVSASEICTVDPVTLQTNSVPVTSSAVIPTPDGKSILVLEYGIAAQIDVLDAQTLAQTATFGVGDFPAGTYVVVSLDSSTVYLAPQLGGIVYAYSISNGVQVGWMPDLFTNPIGTWITAMDNTGLLAGVNVEGIGFLDTTAMQTDTPGRPFLGGEISPQTGPIGGGTAVNLYLSPSQNLAAVYFGQNLATSISPSGSLLYATTPPGSQGPADVVSILGDGSTIIMPEAFNYGPTILEVTPNASTAEGTGTGVIFGYGFGPFGQAGIPQGLQVAVGGQRASITGFNPLGYSYGTAPTPVQSISFTIPPGIAGSSADIQVTSSSGSATAQAAVSYLPAVQQFPLNGAALAQGIYDPYQDVYYFTDANKIQIFSKTQGQWLTPISIPAPNGATQRLWGIALSPDGTKMAVADVAAGVIYELNPSSPISVATFSVSPTVYGTVDPVAVAISDAGMIYYATWAPDVDGAPGFFKLDTATGAITDYGINSPGLVSDVFLHAAISSDNSQAFFNQDGAIFFVHTASDKLTWAKSDPTCCYGDYDLTLSSGQTTLEATSYLYDTNLNAESYLVLNDREYSYISYVYGTQLSADGTLLFQPSTNGIDVYDGRLGTLLTRIALPVALSQNYDALVADGKDNVLIAITGTTGSAIAVVDLSSVTEPAPLPYVSSIVRATIQGSMNENGSTPHRRSKTPEQRVVPKFKVPHVTNGISPTKVAVRRKQTRS